MFLIHYCKYSTTYSFPLLKTQQLTLSFLISFYLSLGVFNAYAEGTKEIMPTSSAHGMLLIYPGFTNFATYDCSETLQLKIRVSTSSENIHYGFGDVLNDDGSIVTGNTQYRIKNPSGTVVFTGNVPKSGTGYISTYEQAVAGPVATSGSTGGYTGLMFDATMTGDYIIEFSTAASTRYMFKYFDITVATSTGTKKPGRVWSKSWQLTAQTENFSTYYPFTGSMYVYSDDNIVTKVYFNSIQPYVFSVTCNDVGTNYTGDPIVDRQSKYGTGIDLLAQYKIFLNDPDNNLYPTGTFGSITAPITTQSFCNGGTNFFITVNKSGKVEMFFDINPLPGVQPEDLKITQDVVAGSNTIYWPGTNGLGQFIANGTTIPVVITYINGLTNLPLKDPDNNPNGFIVSLIRPVGPTPKIYWDDSQIGGTVNLDGCVTESGCHAYGTGIGNSNTINTWWYASSTSTDTIEFEYRYTSYATVNAPLCPGGTLVINGNTITTPGTYQATLVNYMGCDSLVTYNVSNATNPTVTLPPDATLCPGEDFVLDAGPGQAGYLWSNGEFTQTITVNQPGTYWVTVTNAQGCTATDSFIYSSSAPGPIMIKHN